jgi:integrase
MKASILSRIVRVADNLYRDPKNHRYYGVKKIGGARRLHSLDATTDRKTAEGKLKDWLDDLQNVGNGPDKHLTFHALLEKFLASRAAKSAHTRENDESFARVLRQTFRLGMKIPVRNIATSDLLTWLNKQAAARGWRGRTFNHYRLWLRQIFDLAVADGVLDEVSNPFKTRFIRPKKRDEVTRKIPTLEQFGRIIADIRESDYQPKRGQESANFLEFLGLAGVGQAEASALRWRDISGDKIWFLRRKTGKKFYVPIYTWLAPLIARLRAARTSDDEQERVFSILEAGKALENACDRLEYPRFTQRNLRAMCIRRLYDVGIPVKQIALWQGHSDGGQLIQQIYTEVFSADLDTAEKAYLTLVTTSKKSGKIFGFSSAA